MPGGGPVGHGRATAEEVGKGDHAAGFLLALKRALDNLDGNTFGGQTLHLVAKAEISRNPGGINGYIIEFTT